MDSISGSNVFSVEPLVLLMKEVIQDEESREILQTKLIPMEYLLHHISTVLLQDQLPKAARETLKVWLQLLRNCLTEAKSILHHSKSRQRCLDCLSNNTGRASKQIKNWRVRFNYLFQALESDFLVFVRGLEAVIAPVIAPMIPLMEAVIEEEEKYHILQSELRALHNLLLDVSAVFLHHQHKVAPERLKIWLRRLHGSLIEANSILHRFGPSQLPQRRLNCLIGNSGRCPQQLNEWKELFNYLFQSLQTDFSMFVTSTSHQMINRAPIHSEESEDPIQSMSEEESEDPIPAMSVEESEDQAMSEEESEDPIPAMSEEESDVQQLSKDEAWELFRRIAFKENPVLPIIEECAKNIADECKGFRLAIILIAAAMKGKNRVDEWETSLSSIKSHADSSSGPDTLHPKLYQKLRWCYDALPNSDLKNCFLYSAMYSRYKAIKVQELVQMWVAEGLVRSKQGDHLMDMAIGQSYVNLLVDRCFFQNTIFSDKEYIIRGWASLEEQSITVDHLVREMAVFIGEEEENCLFKAGQGLQNFPTIFHNEDCKRISVFRNDIQSLPAEFTCPKLVSLMLSENDSIEEVPPGFLVSLTSLKVLHLGDNRGSRRINSIPSSVGQLKQLEFLSLRSADIRDLPEEIDQLSSLQFLDLEHCWELYSLPAKIGELQNLKYLNLRDCYRLKVIPQEIMCQLTSLTTLDAWETDLSMEAESEENSIWILKGLRNLTTLRIKIRVKKGRTTSRIEDGIMGTWLDMRRLSLHFQGDHDDVTVVHLPDDMKKMSKLQFFEMWYYRGSSLPDYICNFQHLEAIHLSGCRLRDLSSLERVPNLKFLRLHLDTGSEELGIGNSGGFLMLEKLILQDLWNLESIGGASNNGVWNESTLPRLRILAINGCPKLKRLPVGTDKLPNLSTIFGPSEWWHQINWEDGDMKTRLENLYKEWGYWFS